MNRETQDHEARDEALFREVNDAFASSEDVAGGEQQVVYCECPDESCVEEVFLTVEAYEHVRAHSRRFIVRPEHVLLELESIVERRDGYWVVEKHGVAGQVAEDTDPRS